MKKLLLFFLVMTALVTYSWAQQTVSGTVKSSDDGVALPGVAVVIVGTTQGTVTDGEGNYRLDVPSGSRLQFSYVGYQSQEIAVGSQSVINISLAADITQLSEVVVTALGIERDTKALGYSVTSVDGDNFTEARENNLANALVGRVAGVNVSKTAGGPAGSSRVIIRGNKSLEGNNQPLYVVDGIPMDNSGFGQAGLWGGRDEGDGMASLNPDDIESITVLKGANAAALYGSRAANGVINIVTKKGSARKGIGVEFNSNYVFERVNDLRDFQTEWGQGGFIDDDLDATTPRVRFAPRTQQEAGNWATNGWGPKFGSAGAPATAIQFDGITRPYENAGDNFTRYFETGKSWTNTIALSGGSESQNFRVSYSDLVSSSVIPNAGFNRQNLSLSTNSRFGKNLIMNAKVLYSHEYTKNRPYLSDSPANGILSMYYVPNNVNVENYKGDPNKLGAIPAGQDAASLTLWGKIPGEEYQAAYSNNWHQNPYWTAYQFDNSDWRDRLIGSGQLRYNFTDWLYIQARGGMDWYTRRERDMVPQGTGYQRGGSVTEAEDRIKEINAEWIAGMDRTFGPISVNAFVGGNIMRRSYERLQLNGNTFYGSAFFNVITNTQTRTWNYNINERGINSLFGSAEIGYNGFLYLTATARNDWFSVLEPENNSILYPSIGGSFVFSEAFEVPDIISFGKVRASWAQVGNATIDPYYTKNLYSVSGNTHNGYTLASFTSAGGNNGRIPNAELQPLTSTELEFGLDMRFLDNRLGIDFTYYSQNTTEDILNATISRASGFGRITVNVGELKNSGIELLLTGTPVRGPLTWDIALNLAKNDNEVVSLIEGATELVLEEPRSRNAFIKHIVGQPFGVITGRVQRIDPATGLGVYYSNGRPVGESLYQIIGNGVPDLTGGLENSLTFKNFNLSFLIDFKFGGDILSGTNMRMTGAGFTKRTLQGREGEEPLTVSGVTQTGTAGDGSPIYSPFELTLNPDQAASYWSSVQGEADADTRMFLYDASFSKLRHVTLGYNFPRAILSKTPFQNLTLSFVARNLAIISKNVDNIDPEASYTNSNSQGLDYFGFPATRSYGFNLRATF